MLEFYWTAMHLTPYEHFNSCADVRLSNTGGGGGGNDATHAPAPETPATHAPASGHWVSLETGALQASMDQWCQDNCAAGYCPDTTCKTA